MQSSHTSVCIIIIIYIRIAAWAPPCADPTQCNLIMVHSFSEQYYSQCTLASELRGYYSQCTLPSESNSTG